MVSGWGHTMNSSESRKQLRAAHVSIVNQAKCIEKYQSMNTVTPQMICAGVEEGRIDGRRISNCSILKSPILYAK